MVTSIDRFSARFALFAATLMLLLLAPHETPPQKTPPQKTAAKKTAARSKSSPNLIRILVIDGQPKTKFFSDETAYLMAFFGVIQDKDDVRHRYKVIRRTKLQLNKEVTELLDIVYLCNLEKLTTEQGRLLEDMVRQGGAVIIAAGNKVDPKLYNKLLYRDGKGMLPGKLGDHVFLKDSRPKYRKGAGASKNYPANSLPTFQRAYDVDTSKSAKTEVIVTVGDNKPLLLVKTFGKGRCVLFSSTFDMGWNRLAVHPLFVTTMLEIIEYAKGTTIPRKRTKKVKRK